MDFDCINAGCFFEEKDLLCRDLKCNDLNLNNYNEMIQVIQK